MNQTELIILNNDLPEFLIEWHHVESHYAQFSIHKVTEWEDKSPTEHENYLTGMVKWDGCSDFSFDPNLHLCGKSDYDLHCQLISAICSICSGKIKDFNLIVAR